MTSSDPPEESNTLKDANAEYLALALKWLRLCLEKATPDSTVKATTVTRAQKAMLAIEQRDPPPAIVTLRETLGLTRFEQNLLMLCAAGEWDEQILSLCAKAQDNPARPFPTFTLALSIFKDPVWDVVSPHRPLRHWRLIEILQGGVEPLTVSPLRADERVVNYLKGMNYLDDRLSALLFPLNETGIKVDSPIALAPSQQRIVEDIIRYLDGTQQFQRLPILQLLGPDSLSKQRIAGRVAAAFGMSVYRLSVDLLPTQAAELETFSRLWQREIRLFPVALYLDAQAIAGTSSETGTTGTSAALRRFLAECDGLFFLDAKEQRLALERSTITLDVVKPTPTEQRDAWEQALGDQADRVPATLASQFSLNLDEIWQVALGTQDTQGEGTLQARLWDACLVSTRPQLDALAQRLDTKAAWDDLVLPDEQLGLLHQIANQVHQRSQVYDDWGFRRRMNRGLGVNALFSGASGTGKTMAAEVIANDLNLNLYRIDLSSVVSKYIGETEKNLRRLFDAAEDGGAILFFDEADSLFGKRSEIKDSHDRYANIEVNYLLQRIESYRGLAVLATNFKSSIDTAFLRRLRFIIDFPFPSATNRQQLWQKAFPKEMPLGELDYEHLGRINIAGGSIHTIAINAAFLAASQHQQVEMSHVLQSTRAELRKLERPIYEPDFTYGQDETFVGKIE
ncbi:MAG: ATP-binding protein [Cyanobacteria bacterium J06639_16]